MLRRQDNLIGQILQRILMKQRALKIVDNCLNTNIYSYLETTGGQNYNLYLNVVDFFSTSVN
jgi:hypothetical protein